MCSAPSALHTIWPDVTCFHQAAPSQLDGEKVVMTKAAVSAALAGERLAERLVVLRRLGHGDSLAGGVTC